MARMPRLVVPGYPHHVTQRGNRRMKTFFGDRDYKYYLELFSDTKEEAGIEVWAYCLMPNHVHFVVVPRFENSLSRLFRSVHRHYSRAINFRENWKGHLWQERFHSFVMDERYLLATVRYVELNPVKAKLCRSPEDWLWSSAKAHIQGIDDNIVNVQPMLDRVSRWRDYLVLEQEQADLMGISPHNRTGRPAGSNELIEKLEQVTGRYLKKKKPGPKPRLAK